jgi:prepilin-type N-terminal cleavage/methylation domain-containing protein
MKQIKRNKELIRSTFSANSYSHQQRNNLPYFFSQKGFSLIEVLIVIAIIGIVSAIAVPNMTIMMRSYRLKSAANDLASTLQLARMTAIAQNSNSVVTFNTISQSYLVFSDNGDGGGPLDINNNVQSGTEPTIKTVSVRNEYSGEITLGTPSFGLTTYFNAQGGLKENGAGSIVLQNTSGESRQIFIAQGGSVKVVKP